jgi:hypothetical protein
MTTPMKPSPIAIQCRGWTDSCTKSSARTASKAFKIDEAGYADILKQVRDSDFEKQLHERLELAERDKRNAVELAQTKAAGELQKAAAAKDGEIQELKARLEAGEVARKLAVSEALAPSRKSAMRSPTNSRRPGRTSSAATELAEAGT